MFASSFVYMYVDIVCVLCACVVCVHGRCVLLLLMFWLSVCE